ncbi:MAG: nitroreductase [Chloroflexi bacterium]|nr:nitroreductase [Chloroflexota bacterium]
MDVRKAIETRRAYRSLDPVEITDELVRDLAEAASLAPSCFNNQPWRFVFADAPAVLQELFGALSKTNTWVQQASMIVVPFTKSDLDCQIKGREYALFDVGMGTAFLILRATELGLVAHPIGGYNHERVKEILGIPEEYTAITLVVVGRHSQTLSPLLTEKQIGWEQARPERLPLEQIAFRNRVEGL